MANLTSAIKPRGTRKAGKPAPVTMPRVSEHQQQAAWFKWLGLYLPTVGVDPKLAFAIPNGQILLGLARSQRSVLAYLAAEGLRSGVPDTMIAVPRHTFHGLFVEHKSADGKLHDNQIEIQGLLRGQGYNVVTVWSIEEAQRVVKAYFDRKYPSFT